MTAIVHCPECRRSLHVPDDFFGRKVQCPDCRHTFVADPPEAAIQVAAPLPSAPSPPPEERRPRRARDDDEEWDDDLEDLRRGKGHDSGLDADRGGVILAMGIASLAVAFFSFMLYFVPVWLIPLILGIIGWIMGYRDLRAMREGTMDKTNQVMTQVGMILSIVGVGISVCVAMLGCAVLGLFGVMFWGIAANAPPPGRGGAPRRF
jgi:hypothetical protein